MMRKFFLFVLAKIFGRTSPHYGHGRILKKYLRFPRFLPLNAQIQHGWYGDSIIDLDAIDRVTIMLVWSKRMAEEWKRYSRKPVYVLGSPFAHYRRLHRVERQPDARGTVVFPDHSTPNTKEVHDVDAYCRQLSALPEHLKPITVCLHYRDVDSYGPLFEKYGYQVVTAGHGRQGGDGFVKRFYEILSRHRYSCSNEIGSYTFYAIDMGIPFFLYGPESKTVMRSDQTVLEKEPFRQRIRDTFRNVSSEVPQDQISFVQDELGIHDCIKPSELRRILLRRFFFHELPMYPIRLFLFPLAAMKAFRNRRRSML